MSYLIVELRSQTASFRDPEFQNYHRSLLLPPPTTVFGLTGAAMGLGPQATQRFFDAGPWTLGIYGSTMGRAKDLWKYQTLKANNPKSIILREFMYGNRFVFAFGHPEQAKLDEVAAAFQGPIYALTMGNSDSLAKVVSVQREEATTTSREVAHCLMAGNVLSAVMHRAGTEPVFSVYTTSDPITFDLPTRFSYAREYGVRSVSRRQQFSVIGKEMTLNFDVVGLRYAGVFIPTFQVES
ncbi:MAG: CRISPR-associated protein Cas5 [Catalinimonas sp.]